MSKAARYWYREPVSGVTAGAVLAALDAAGLWVVSAAFDRERLVLGTR